MNVDPEIEALVLATLAKRVKDRTDLVKAVVGTRYVDGHKETFRSPLDDSKLGIVYRTDPDPKWQIVDREALDAELRTHPGALETVYEIADMQSAIDVLHNTAPHLLAEVTRVKQEVVDAALQQSKETGAPVAAGIAKVKPAGSLTVKPDPAAAAAVERMVQAGVITWDGQPVLEERAS